MKRAGTINREDQCRVVLLLYVVLPQEDFPRDRGKTCTFMYDGRRYSMGSRVRGTLFGMAGKLINEFNVEVVERALLGVRPLTPFAHVYNRCRDELSRWVEERAAADREERKREAEEWDEALPILKNVEVEPEWKTKMRERYQFLMKKQKMNLNGPDDWRELKNLVASMDRWGVRWEGGRA